VQIHRTEHRASYTVLPNNILRHPELSLSAVGLLSRLLSMPDGTTETISSLAMKVREGKRRVSAAYAELIEAGYVLVRRSQDARTGLWTTQVSVYDTPKAASPEVAEPTPGHPEGRNPGPSTDVSTEGKYQGNNPPTLPSVTEAQQEAAPAEGEGEVPKDKNEHQEQDAESRRAGSVLASLGQVDKRLRLSSADIARLVPMAAEWLRRGVSSQSLRADLLDGLPQDIAVPAGLVANRLERKMPTVPLPVEPVVPLVTCDTCERTLVRGQMTGSCGVCVGTHLPASALFLAPASEADFAEPSPEGLGLLDAIRQRRATGDYAHGARRRPALV